MPAPHRSQSPVAGNTGRHAGTWSVSLPPESSAPVCAGSDAWRPKGPTARPQRKAGTPAQSSVTRWAFTESFHTPPKRHLESKHVAGPFVSEDGSRDRAGVTAGMSGGKKRVPQELRHGRALLEPAALTAGRDGPTVPFL